MPDCIDISSFGGGFLQPILNLPIAAGLNLGQIYEKINVLQSFSSLQGLNFTGASGLFSTLSQSLSSFASLGFTNPLLNNAQNLLGGLTSLPGFTNGLLGFIQTPDLSSLLTTQGADFMTGLRDLLGTSGYLSHLSGIDYLNDAFNFVGTSLSSNLDGINILSSLPFPPVSSGGLPGVGFLSPIIQAYGDGIGLEAPLKNITTLFNELRGIAFTLHGTSLNSNQDLTDFNTLISQMNSANLLHDKNITGPAGAGSMANMLAILQTFAR